MKLLGVGVYKTRNQRQVAVQRNNATNVPGFPLVGYFLDNKEDGYYYWRADGTHHPRHIQSNWDLVERLVMDYPLLSEPEVWERI